VKTEIDLKGASMRTVRILTLAILGLCALAANAKAAPAPAPSPRVLAVTAPTHLPPRQSEVQRVTVEAEGGTFTLSPILAEGQGTLSYAEGVAETVEGSNMVQMYFAFAGTFEVGQTLVGEGIPAGTTIIGVTPSGEEATLEISDNATESTAGIYEGLSKEVTGFTTTSGQFVAGQGISGEGIEPGTTVAAVGADTLTLSSYAKAAGTVELKAAPTTAPLPFDASAETVQGALEALSGFSPGLLTVSGGPGGGAGNPYFLAYGGPFANQNAAEISADSSGLTGAHPFVHVFTIVPGGVGTGEIVVLLANAGGLPSSGLITAEVGPLPAGIVTTAPGVGTEWECPGGGAGESTITCTMAEPLRVLHASPNALSIPIEVQAGAPASATVPVEISGGGTAKTDTYQLPIVVSKEPASFGVSAAWAGSFEADGSPSVQAGGHPQQSAAYIMLNSRRTAAGAFTPAGDSKNVVVDLPPGFTGNPLAGKRCPQSLVVKPLEQDSDVCNEEMSVGNLDPFIGEPKESLKLPSRLYNNVPPKGYAAEFTTRLAFPLQSVLATVNSEDGFGIRLTGPNNANFDKIYGVYAGFEGVPQFGNGQALLSNPVNCAESRQNQPVVRARANTFQDPLTYPETVIPQPALTGCENLKFEGKDPQTGQGQVGFAFQPTSTQGSTPVGAEAHLHIDQPGLTDPNELATPHLKRSVIRFPEGLNLNASSANGLGTCSEAEIGYRGDGFPMPSPMRFTEAAPGCPDASKIGSAEVRTPLLDNPLVGTLYLAAQEENPFGSLLAVYLVVNDPLSGVIIKLPGEVNPDPTTGQLTVTFDNNPQLPFEDLILKIRGGGPRSQFATPEVCGTYTTAGTWTPWSAPESGPPAQTSDSFTVSGGCAGSPAARPFAPSFEAGTTATNAGGYNPLVIKVNRNDGEQELTSLDFTLPKGLIGKLAGIPYCTDADIQSAEHKTGSQEKSNPSCPAASQIGSLDTSAGVGSAPFHVGGKLYLAGPYKGAPVSSVVITPALAGPFDLGDVVVRAPLYVDHETTELTAKSDPIPTILRGIPLKIRSVNIDVNRGGFILNPTNCTPMAVSSSLAGGSGATSKASTRFQVGGCKNLQFAPKLRIKLKGRTKRAGFPALTAILTQPAGQANIGFVSVALPHSEFLEQGHIRTNCTRVQFAAEQCPKGSIYGHAEAVTPLLDQPLRGPVYLRSSSHRLPDLVAALKGPPSQPIEVDLDGRIDSYKGGIRTTFETVPDAPVSKFVLRMQGGKKSLIVNSTNICKGKHKARVRMTGQNGREHNFSQRVQPKCGKKHHRKHRRHTAKHQDGKQKGAKKSKAGKR
jgi:hypothetical protein